MSETDRDVLALLDRAAADSPPLHLDRESVVGRGRQIVRRRRAGGAGMAIGGLALAGAVWLGPGFGVGLLGTQEISPASVSWEVDEPTTVTVLDGVTRGGNVPPLTVTKDGDSATATFVVNGREETVEGERMAGGVDLFVGEGATVAVWADPEGRQHRVQPWPESTGSRQIGRAQGDEDLWYLISDPGYVPEDLIFSSDHEVWTASGLVAETAELTDGRVDAVAFALSDLAVAGFLVDGSISLMGPDTGHHTGGTEPWWRGRDDYSTYVIRPPDGATHVRPVWLETQEGELTGAVATLGGSGRAVTVGDASFAVFSFTEDEDPSEGGRNMFTFQWSTDRHTWHDQDDGQGTENPASTVGPGGQVTLLGERYEVAADAHGWPQLLDADGSVFLTVSDPDGPPPGSGGGGSVMWREHWWPWSDRHEVHFAYSHDGRPSLPPGTGQDVLTITAPAGEVLVVAVPAGS